MLTGLGVADAADGFAPVPSLRLVSPGGAVVARPAAPPRVHRSPAVFDARLVAAATVRTARSQAHTVRAVDFGPAGGADRRHGLTARVVIGADGAGSVIRRVLGHGANPDGHLALAIRGYAPAAEGDPEQRIVTSTRRWPAYAWTFPIGDGRANVGYGEVLRGQPLTRAHLVDRLAALLPTSTLPRSPT